MLYPNTLYDVSTNTNPGVEYEIAIFYKLLKRGSSEANSVLAAINKRADCRKVMQIISVTNEAIVLNELRNNGLSLVDVTFETQNDDVGPADVVMIVQGPSGDPFKLGLSVKYANRNTLNPTARKFMTDAQIARLQERFDNEFIPAYLEEMKNTYGHVSNWKRKRSKVVDAYYDLLRDAVIENWPNVANKVTLLAEMFHSNSPIPFWVINYTNTGYSVETEPDTIDEGRVDDIVVEKYRDAFVAFKLDGKIFGKVQVKCNNGFIEDQFNHAGKAKKKTPDFVINGEPRIKGKPFGSWDFTLGA